ncbi:hypothetical protein AURDEDRAFT_150933 [Auricularia subglabra TFB-10046 SS5]|nr:hypothetical protein AURDEDRAFT_150933 [Auricularia subglabra TFB-10046 SS5]
MSQRTIVRLNDFVLVSKPARDADTQIVSAAEHGPSFVVILGWMDAKPLHLLKYSSAYEKLWPASTHIIVQQSFWGLIFSSLTTRMNELVPIIDVFKEAGVDFADPSSSRGIILHALSNGGVSRLIRLEALLHKVAKGVQPRRHAPVAFIFDSNPASPIFHLLLGAITTGWNLPLKIAFALVFTPCYWFLRISHDFILGRTNPAEGLRQRLARTELFAPWTTSATPRTFVYSTADTTVPPEGIEAHIADVKRLGIDVHVERYTDSSHVAHARKDPERYWRVVRETWARACAAQAEEDKRAAPTKDSPRYVRPGVIRASL